MSTPDARRPSCSRLSTEALHTRNFLVFLDDGVELEERVQRSGQRLRSHETNYTKRTPDVELEQGREDQQRATRATEFRHERFASNTMKRSPLFLDSDDIEATLPYPLIRPSSVKGSTEPYASLPRPLAESAAPASRPCRLVRQDSTSVQSNSSRIHTLSPSPNSTHERIRKLRLGTVWKEKYDAVTNVDSQRSSVRERVASDFYYQEPCASGGPSIPGAADAVGSSECFTIQATNSLPNLNTSHREKRESDIRSVRRRDGRLQHGSLRESVQQASSHINLPHKVQNDLRSSAVRIVRGKSTASVDSLNSGSSSFLPTPVTPIYERSRPWMEGKQGRCDDITSVHESVLYINSRRSSMNEYVAPDWLPQIRHPAHDDSEFRSSLDQETVFKLARDKPAVRRPSVSLRRARNSDDQTAATQHGGPSTDPSLERSPTTGPLQQCSQPVTDQARSPARKNHRGLSDNSGSLPRNPESSVPNSTRSFSVICGRDSSDQIGRPMARSMSETYVNSSPLAKSYLHRTIRHGNDRTAEPTSSESTSPHPSASERIRRWMEFRELQRRTPGRLESGLSWREKSQDEGRQEDAPHHLREDATTARQHRQLSRDLPHSDDGSRPKGLYNKHPHNQSSVVGDADFRPFQQLGSKRYEESKRLEERARKERCIAIKRRAERKVYEGIIYRARAAPGTARAEKTRSELAKQEEMLLIPGRSYEGPTRHPQDDEVLQASRGHEACAELETPECLSDTAADCASTDEATDIEENASHQLLLETQIHVRKAGLIYSIYEESLALLRITSIPITGTEPQVIQALRICTEMAVQNDPILAVSNCPNTLASINKIAAELQVDPEAMRRALCHDGVRIVGILQEILDSNTLQEKALELQGTAAQRFLDSVQNALDKIPLYGLSDRRSFDKKAGKLIAGLSKKCGMLPSSLFIQGIDNVQSRAIFGGSFGDIYRGSYHGMDVALKRIRVFQRDTEYHEIHEKLCREAIIWQTFDHPNVLPFLGIDADSFPPLLCLVSPWMANGAINKYLKAFGRSRLLVQLTEIAQGIEYLHAQHIAHGDLRGANILVDDGHHARLADFGLTVFYDGTTAARSATQGGSIRWMAPELLWPDKFGLKSFRRTPASDMYSYACVAFELYTGGLPWPNITHDAAVISEVICGNRPTRPTEELNPPDAVWEVVERCWDHNASKRWSATDTIIAMTETHKALK